MKTDLKEYLKNEFGIDERVLKVADSALIVVASEFSAIDSVKEYNQF